MPAIQGVVETCIYVNDLDVAERFYGGVLGLAVAARQPGRHIFFHVGDRDVLLAFLAAATLQETQLPTHGTNGPGHFALGIASADLEAWRRRLLEHGIAIEKEMNWPRGGRSLYFRDPAGNSGELVTPGVWGTAAGW
jgi:catechol 2,3-dioxygenase-like lactoylglutathione lyase family enzyme